MSLSASRRREARIEVLHVPNSCQGALAAMLLYKYHSVTTVALEANWQLVHACRRSPCLKPHSAGLVERTSTVCMAQALSTC